MSDTTEPRLGLALQAMGRELATIGYTSRLTKIATDVLEAFDAVYDRQSSGSVQHYIETGAYLTHEEAREWSTDPDAPISLSPAEVAQVDAAVSP